MGADTRPGGGGGFGTDIPGGTTQDVNLVEVAGVAVPATVVPGAVPVEMAGGNVDVNIIEVAGVAVAATVVPGAVPVEMAGGNADVNIIEIAGNAVAATGVSGTMPVEGATAEGFNPNDNPVGTAGVDPAGRVTRFAVDLGGDTIVVGTQAAESGSDDASWPVKVAAIVRAVLTAITDGDVSNLLSDTYGRLYTHEAGYDSLLDALKVANTNTDATDRDEAAQVIANATPAAQAYFPSSAGIEIGNRDFLSWVVGMRDGDLNIEVSNDGTNWVNATKQPVDVAEGTNGYDDTHYAEPDAGTVYFGMDWERCGYRYIRWDWTPGDATSIFTCYLIQRAL